MILDLHAHSIVSDDGRAKVENYCQWIRTREVPVDGLVLTEHRKFDIESDYSALARRYDLVILKGSEVETEYGHVLVFNVTSALQKALDFSDIRLRLELVIETCERYQAVPVPCHPGRPRVGMHSHIAEYGVPSGVRVVETRNGGSRAGEDELAQQMALDHGYVGIGGSDAHIVSHIGRCATRFPDRINDEATLAEALRSGDVEAVDTRD